MHFLGLNYDNETLIYYRSALNIHSNFFPFKMTFRGSFEAKNSTFSCQANISLTRQRMHFRQFFKVALYFTCILQKSFRDPTLKRFQNFKFWMAVIVSKASSISILYAYLFSRVICKIDIGCQKHFSKGLFFPFCSLVWFGPRTTDAQRRNSLHCTAKNSIPIPNF